MISFADHGQMSDAIEVILAHILSWSLLGLG